MAPDPAPGYGPVDPDADSLSTTHEPDIAAPPVPPGLPSRMLGHYRVLSQLGRGGMGVVYRALDTKLQREVALKVLTPDLLDDPHRRARLVREAQAAASLNHPHIAAVHEIGEVDGVSFIVLELIPGQKLRDVINRGPVPVAHALTLAVEIAEALSCAHEHGIIHRDLKPGNVMVTKQGHVKVIDFGLAKVAEPSLGGAALNETSHSSQIAGTVSYMSPEQARGQHIDHRSDIFSFGVMLQELLTGRRPFDRPNAVDTLAAIVRDEPQRLSDLAGISPGTAMRLQEVLERCLAKGPDHRYQRTSDLVDDLRAVQRSVELQQVRPSSWPSSTRWRMAAVAAGAVVVTAIAAAVITWYGLVPDPFRRRVAGRASEQDLPLTSLVPRRVTSAPGWQRSPALSPDGTLIAYVSDVSGNPDIWVIDVTGGEALRLTDDPAAEEKPAWFPDGSAIAFVSTRSGEPAIWRVPRLGGNATMLVPNALDPDLSPDGTRIAFARATPNGQLRIATAPLADPLQARFLSGDGGGLWNHEDPVWSPDGSRLCYAASDGLWQINSSGGPARPLTRGQADVEPAWSRDGRYVYFASYREGTLAIWRTPADGGDSERQTTGTGAERHPTIARQGGRVAYATFRENPDIILLDLQTGKRNRLESGQAEMMPTLAPDNSSVVFMSDRPDGEFRLLLQPLVDGVPSGRARPLVDDRGSASHPSYSPDGKWIAYYRNLPDPASATGRRRNIWIVPTGGGPATPLTDDHATNVHPAWSRDGAYIAFASDASGGQHIWVTGIRDGRPTGPARQLTFGTRSESAPAWSSDGRRLAYIASDENSRSDVWIVPVDGRTPPRRITREGVAARVAWQRDGRAIFVSGLWEGHWASLRRIEPETGAVLPLRNAPRFSELSYLVDFDISHDGRLLAYAEGIPLGDIWVLEPRKQDTPSGRNEGGAR